MFKFFTAAALAAIAAAQEVLLTYSFIADNGDGTYTFFDPSIGNTSVIPAETLPAGLVLAEGDEL